MRSSASSIGCATAAASTRSQVRKRYRTLEMDEVALVLLVHERPGISARRHPPGPFRRLRSRLMFLPILHLRRRVWVDVWRAHQHVVDALGQRSACRSRCRGAQPGARRSKRSGRFKSGPLTRVLGSFGIAQRENPHFEVDDQRTELRGRAERRLVRHADARRRSLGAPTSRSAAPTISFWTTRRGRRARHAARSAFPSDAVFVGAGVEPPPSDRRRVRHQIAISVDARGYKRLIGQTVIAVRAEYDTADRPAAPVRAMAARRLRPARHPRRHVRRRQAAARIRRAARAVLVAPERRTPRLHRVHGRRHQRRRTASASATSPPTAAPAPASSLSHRSSPLNLDVAHSLDGYGTRVHFSTGFTFWRDAPLAPSGTEHH